MSESLLNRKKCKGYFLDYAQETRYHRFERVSGAFLDYLEAELKKIGRAYIKDLPSKGKTIK